LLYGNYKDEPKKEIVTSSRNHAKFDRPLTTNPISKPLKFAKMKSYNYAQKLVDASENKRNKPSLHTIDRSTPVNKNKNKVRGSMDTFKTSGTNSSMQMIHSGRYFDSKNPSIFFQRRQSDKPHIKQKLTKKLLNSKNSSINKYFKKETAKISKKYIHSQSLRSSLEASRNEAQKVNISHRNTYKSKVLYLGRTKKKMQPIFLLKSTKPKKTLDKKTKSTLRIFSKGQAHKITEGISK